MPAILTLVSLRSTPAMARRGSSRQLGRSCGRAVTTTLPRKLLVWSKVLVASVSICLPRERPSNPPMASPMPPTAWPAALPSWPVMWMVPVSGVTTVSVSLAPATEIEPRDTCKPISALSSSWLTGLSFLPAKSRGAVASSRLRMALSATATGATTCEVRDIGGSGGGGGRVAKAGGGLSGRKWSSAHSAP